MSLYWNIANKEPQPGGFDEVERFLPPNPDFAACEIKVPERAENKLVPHATGGLLSDTIRSFEIWWDKKEKDLKIALVTTKNDMPLYMNAYQNMYPNCSMSMLKNENPNWYARERPYNYFTLGNRNGNHVVIWENLEAEYFMTQLITAVQLARHAWVQCVFRQHPRFVGILQQYSRNLIKYKKVMENDEKGFDFTNNVNQLHQMALEKQNDTLGIMSIRGLVEFEQDLNIIKQIPCSMIKTTGIDSLESYQYHSNRFFSNSHPDYINNSGWQRCDVFPNRMLPSSIPYTNDILDYMEQHGIMEKNISTKKASAIFDGDSKRDADISPFARPQHHRRSHKDY